MKKLSLVLCVAAWFLLVATVGQIVYKVIVWGWS